MLLDTANLYNNPTTGPKNQHIETLLFHPMTSFSILLDHAALSKSEKTFADQ